MKLPETKNKVLKVEDGVAYLELTQGQVAKVDVEDLELIGRHRWCVTRSKKRYTYYTYARDTEGHYSIHRIVMQAGPGELVDHINGDGLDNTKKNLRLCSHAENSRNRISRIGKSKFKGVARKNSRWRAYIGGGGTIRHRHLGMFDTEAEAAVAYDKAALKLHGEFARTNILLTLPSKVQ